MNKLLFPPSTATVRPAARTFLLAFGLAFCFGLSGCRSSGPDPTAFNTPPTDAYALSGGKITHFIGNPGLPSDPYAKALLKACRSLPYTSHTAQSVYLSFRSRKGVHLVPALQVGNVTIVLMGSIDRMLNGEVDRITASILNLPGGTRQAHIGKAWVALKIPIIAVDHGSQTIVSFTDLLALFHASDIQHGGIHEIQYLRTYKDLNFLQLNQVEKN